MKHISKNQTIGRSLAIGITFATLGLAQDLIPPSVPTGLTAATASCGQVNLSWNASVDNTGGSGLKAYLINRTDGMNNSIAIGAIRTTFSDTNWVKSSTTMTYNVVSMDYAGNKSAASNSVTVTTPPCPTSSSEQIVDSAYMDVFGKTIATYGSRTAFIYAKQNAQLTLDTWVYIHDEDTGQTSRFLLHTSPGYRQIEADYILTSTTELWTLSWDPDWGGKLLASQYRLNGSTIPTSATLLSTKPLGDSNSWAKSMIRLKSGALMIAWNEEGFTYTSPDGTLNTGYAYRSPAGAWTINFPVSIPNPYGGNIPRTQMAMTQHPADGSIWVFAKRDSYSNINALHFTELPNGFVVDWINPGYISSQDGVDGMNGPEGEFPLLAAAADPTRNAILLAYQSHPYEMVFVDSLFNIMNGIFLKDSYATVAQINANGGKTFIPFQTWMEREAQFGFSVLSDGTLWLTYQPINHQTLTFNEVYASKYSNGAWSAPARVGFKYMSGNVSNAAMDAGFVVGRVDQPQVAFLTPDQKIHTVMLSGSTVPSSDTTPPTTLIASPLDGATVSGVISVTASASDNIGVTRVDLQIDGVVKGSKSAAPYTFTWDTSTAAAGKHTLQTLAYDAAGNKGSSSLVSDTVAAPVDSISPNVAIVSPSDGGTVPRNTTVTMTATASDNIGVTKVDFYVNNTLTCSDTGTPYNCAWKVPGKNNASYTVKATAYDAAGHSTISTITVTAK